MNARALSQGRISNRRFESFDPLPFTSEPDITVGSYLIQAPVDLKAMAIGIEKLDCDLTAGPAAAFECDCDTPFAQPLARGKHFVNGRYFESNMMESRRLRQAQSRASEGNCVMIRAAAQECESSRLQILGINFGDCECQNLRMEKQGTLQVGDPQHDMAETANLRAESDRRLEGSQLTISKAMATTYFGSNLSSSLSPMLEFPTAPRACDR